MKLYVDYDPYLRKEALITVNIIKKIFGFGVAVKAKQHPEVLNFDEDLGIYQPKYSEDLLNTIYITGNQIASVSAKSSEDFSLGGTHRKTKMSIISLARLRGKKFEDTSLLQIPFSEYKRRIEEIVIHEIGHWAVEDKSHFDEIEPLIDNGDHCPDRRCVMYPTLPTKNTKRYKNYFCQICRKSLLKI